MEFIEVVIQRNERTAVQDGTVGPHLALSRTGERINIDSGKSFLSWLTEYCLVLIEIAFQNLMFDLRPFSYLFELKPAGREHSEPYRH
jgi:hypothetical protein